MNRGRLLNFCYIADDILNGNIFNCSISLHMYPNFLKLLFPLLVLGFNVVTAQSTNANCTLSDTVYNGILKIANLPASAALKIDKHIQTPHCIYLSGSITGLAPNGKNLFVAAISTLTGQQIWSKRWQSQIETKTTQDFCLIDGYLYISDVISISNPVLVLTKWDTTGVLIWSKQYDFSTRLPHHRITSIPTLSAGNNEIGISFQLQCNGTSAGCGNVNSGHFYDGIAAATFNSAGDLLWSKVFGGYQDSDGGFYNNRPIGLQKLSSSSSGNDYLLFSETSAPPFITPGTPPNNNYKWIIGTRFSAQSGQNQIEAKYFLPNVTGTNPNYGICYSSALGMQKLESGAFMLYSNNLLVTINKPDDGFFFFQLNEQLQPSSGVIVKSKRYECGNVPYISTSGKILIGDMLPQNDSFTIAAIEGPALLYEKKYPKYRHPNGQYTATRRYATELNGTQKQFIFLHNQRMADEPYTEIHNENIYINKPSCTPATVHETTVTPVAVYSHSISWDTVLTLQVVTAALPILTENASLIYQSNCEVVSRCDSVRLSAPDSICIDQEFKITVHKNVNCYKELEIHYPPASAQFIRKENDSVYILKALTVGNLLFSVRFKDCNISLDTVYVVTTDNGFTPLRLPFHDTTVCTHQTINVTAPAGYKRYIWDKGAALTQSYLISTAGWHYLSTENYCGSISKDSLYIRYDTTQLSFNPSMISLCSGDTGIAVLASGIPISQLNWQPQTLAAFNYTTGYFSTWPLQSTTYHIAAYSHLNCVVLDTLTVNVSALPVPSTILNQNVYQLCTNDSLRIQAAQPFAGYFWSNGDRGMATTVKKAGDYYLQVSNDVGCVNKVMFKVQEISCIRNIFIPTAFTPNNDGLNDFFKAKATDAEPTYFELKVYNRWGQPVFTSNRVQHGWNGYYKGAMQPSGTYTWQCQYSYTSKVITLNGTVTLIR